MRIAYLKKKYGLVFFSAIFLQLLVTATALAQNTIIVKGIVADENNIAMPGVTVIAKNSQNVASAVTKTNTEGIFEFKVPIGGPYHFSISFIGYQTQTLSGYTLKANETVSLSVKMRSEVNGLNDVVIVGYGSQKKTKVTSSIATLKMNDIDQGSSYNGVKAIQGRTAGVQILTPSGIPGTAPVVMVRGVGSISGGSSPLYVVDGVPNETFPNLNPNDIESIEVLKDASASAIYGSRANSGVVIITTKAGAAEKTVINATLRSGWGKVYNDIKMANSQQYAQAMQTAVDNYNTQKGANLVYYKPSEIQETNWVKEISRGSAATKAFDINASGGNEKTQLFTSFGYYNQQGILKTSNYSQYNFRLKIGHEISKYVKLNANISGSAAPRNLVEEDNVTLKVLRNAREEQPWYSPYLANGDYKVNGTYIFRHNPTMEINEETWKRTGYEGLGSINLEIKPIAHLKYIPSISAFGVLTDENKKITEKMVARAQSAGWGAVAQDRNLAFRYVFDNIVSYENSWGNLNYTAMAGHSFEKFTNDRFGAYSDNYKNGAYPSDKLGLINSGTNIYPSANIGYDAYALESYLGRLSLDYDGRYLLNASIRRDGSSKFSKDERYGTFPSVSLGWRMAKENFWKTNDVLSDLKWRVSYGVTGSMAGISNYASLGLIRSGYSYNNQGGFILAQDSQNITWEKAKQFDVGFDAELLKGRIAFTADYFNQKTTDLLYNKPIYASSGYTSIPANIGTLNNQGLELSVNSKVLTGKIKWNLAANISFVKNKLLSLYENTNMYIVPATNLNQVGGNIHALINGKSIGSYYMLKQTGIYQYDKDVPEKLFAKGVRAGDVIYEDVNGDKDITDADRQYAGKATPDFYGGITNNLSYKGFELNVFAQFSVGNKIMASWRGVNSEGTEHLGDAFTNVKVENGQTVEQFFNISERAATGYWNGPGTSNTIPRPVRKGVFSGYTYNYNALPSTRFLEDGSYFKLKTLTLAYNLPARVSQKMKLDNVRFFFSVDNVFTITKYSGYDPEQSFATNPGDAYYGVDFGLQAALRTYMFGINIKF